MNDKDLKRFWSKVQKTDNCWIWTGGVFHCANGDYGRFWLGTKATGKDLYAHRVSFELANGPIPDGVDVCHSCDNPICVNPAHLWPGTHLDNMRDMYKKGRRTAAIGERVGTAKLTWDRVRSMRAYYNDNPMPFHVLGANFGVSGATAHKIIRHQLWREE